MELVALPRELLVLRGPLPLLQVQLVAHLPPCSRLTVSLSRSLLARTPLVHFRQCRETAIVTVTVPMGNSHHSSSPVAETRDPGLRWTRPSVETAEVYWVQQPGRTAAELSLGRFAGLYGRGLEKAGEVGHSRGRGGSDTLKARRT